MEQRLVLVKYGEIHLKGLNRPFFKRLLRQRLANNLEGLHCEVREMQGRDFVSGFAPEAEAEVVEQCANTFGVVGVSPAAQVDKTLEAMAQAAIMELKDAMAHRGLTACTFKVRARREDKSFFPNSQGIAREVGGRILEAMENVKVDVHHPQITVQVEVRDSAYVYASAREAVGGMPIGTSGKGMVMLSGGIDSPVAAYAMAKRGMTVTAMHFMSPPYTGQAAQQKVEDLAKRLACYCGPVRLHLVRFTEFQENIYEKCRHELLTVIMRRCMMRIALAAAHRDGEQALITGESLGQVASQTIEAICTTDAVSDMPVFRPLIGMDKTEIIEQARKIGTFDISIRPGEDCCTVFVPKHPATKPTLEVVEAEEKNLEMDRLVKEAIESMETVVIKRT